MPRALDTDNNLADFHPSAPRSPQNLLDRSHLGPLEAAAPGNKSGQVGSPIADFTLERDRGYRRRTPGPPPGCPRA